MSRWRPHLVLVPKLPGSYWYVTWQVKSHGVWRPVQLEVVPFMCRTSSKAKAAHAFASKLNASRSTA